MISSTWVKIPMTWKYNTFPVGHKGLCLIIKVFYNSDIHQRSVFPGYILFLFSVISFPLDIYPLPEPFSLLYKITVTLDIAFSGIILKLNLQAWENPIHTYISQASQTFYTFYILTMTISPVPMPLQTIPASLNNCKIEKSRGQASSGLSYLNIVKRFLNCGQYMIPIVSWMPNFRLPCLQEAGQYLTD
jgi:hypothetical protein